jgi:Repeat of Unknown Function (DUF347).
LRHRLGTALGDYLADDSELDFGTIGPWRVLAGILVAMIAGRRI